MANINENEFELEDEQSVDEAQFELDPAFEIEDEEPVSERSYTDYLSSSLKGIYQGLENATRNAELGLLRGGELALDTLGFDTPAGVRQLREEQKREATADFLGDDSLARTVSGVTEGAAPAIGLGVATGGAILPSALMAGQSGLERYTQSRDQGADYTQGIAEGGTVGALDYVANRLMLNTPITGQGSVAGRLLRSGAEGAGGGVISESGRVLADIIEGERPTQDEALDRLGNAAEQGAVLSTAIGSGIEGARALGAYSLRGRLDSSQDYWSSKLDELDKTQPIDPTSPSDSAIIIDQANVGTVDKPVTYELDAPSDFGEQVIKGDTLTPKATQAEKLVPEQRVSLDDSPEAIQAKAIDAKAEVEQAPKNTSRSQKQTSDLDSPIKSENDNPTPNVPLKAESDYSGKIEVKVDDPQITQRDIERTDVEREVSKFEGLTKRKREQAGMVFNPFSLFGKDRGSEIRPDVEEYSTPNSLRSTFKRSFERMRTTAEKYRDDIGEYWEAKTIKMPNAMKSIALDLMENLSPYQQLSKAERYQIDGLLLESRKRGKRLEYPELQSLGLNDRLANGVIAANRTMDRALDHAMDAELSSIINDSKLDISEKKIAIDKAQQYFNGLRNRGYVPHMRTGDYYVAARDKNGSLKYYAFVSTKKEAQRLQRELERTTGLSAKYNLRPDVADDSIRRALPGDMAPYLSSINKDKTPNGTIRDNFIEAELIPGQDADLLPSLEKYIAGISRHYGEAKYGHVTKKALDKLDAEGKFGLKSRINEFERSLKNPSNKLEWMQDNIAPLLNLRTLTGNGMNLVANVLEPINIYAQTARYLKATGSYSPGASEFLAAKSAFDMFAHKVGLAPDVAAGFEWAKANGFMDDAKIRELFARNSQQQWSPLASIKELNQFLGTPNRLVEDFVKNYTFTLGLNVAKRAGYQGERAFEFAQNFTNDLKSSGSPVEQNALFRQMPELAQWRNYAANQLRLLGRNVREADLEPLIKTLGLSGFLLGGIYNVLPFQGVFQSLLELEGKDPKQIVRTLAKDPETADFLTYGLPGTAGFDFSRSLGFGNFVTTNEKAGLTENVANTLFGPIFSPYNDARRSIDAFKSGDYPRGARYALPQFLRQFATSADMKRYGLKDARGNYIVTPQEADGFTTNAAMFNLKTKESGKRSEIANSLAALRANDTDTRATIRQNLINALQEKDKARFNELRKDPIAQEILSDERSAASIFEKAKGQNSIKRNYNNLPKRLKREGKELIENMYRGARN